MRRSAYTYTVLQYRHDVWSGEGLNVALLFFCPAERQVVFKFRSGGDRLTHAYPGMSRRALLDDLKEMERWFQSNATQPSDMWMWNSALQLGQSLLGEDDSSFRWVLNGSGITDEPVKAAEKLFGRFVMQHDASGTRQRRTDEEVFETVKAKLNRAKLLARMEPHTFRTDYQDVTFDHSIKNGKWHCVQAISLDYANEDNMEKAAERWSGRLVGLLNAHEKPQVYLITGQPTDIGLRSKYEKMTEMLRHNPAGPKVFDELQSETLVDQLSTVTSVT